MASMGRAFYSLLTIILISSLLIPTAISQDSLLQKLCIDSPLNNTATYAANRMNLLDDLYNHTSRHHGFRNNSVGHGPVRVYGMALCRGDVSAADCEDCVYDARCKITRRCDKQKAMVSYDYCLVKYSDNDFIVGDIDIDNNFVMVNVVNVDARDADRFKAAVIGLLSNLSKEASGNKHMFAGGGRKIIFDNNNNNNNQTVTVYGMAQCSRNLSQDKCRTCLDWAAKEKLPINHGKPYSEGGRVIAPSCNVRYEIYSFLNDAGESA